MKSTRYSHKFRRPKFIVNRFGNILPLWLSFEPTLAKTLCCCSNVHCCTWPNVEQTIWPQGLPKLRRAFDTLAFASGRNPVFIENFKLKISYGLKILTYLPVKCKKVSAVQWLWLSWLRGHLQYQRSEIQIQSLVKLYNGHIYCQLLNIWKLRKRGREWPI